MITPWNRFLNYSLNSIQPLAYIVYLCMIATWFGIALEMIKPLKLFIDRKNLYNLVAIPDICHGRADGVRVNFFGRCKFLQI